MSAGLASMYMVALVPPTEPLIDPAAYPLPPNLIIGAACVPRVVEKQPVFVEYDAPVPGIKLTIRTN